MNELEALRAELQELGAAITAQSLAISKAVDIVEQLSATNKQNVRIACILGERISKMAAEQQIDPADHWKTGDGERAT